MLIGLMGKARSGKDTVADYLVNNYSFEKVAFADPVKDFVEKHFHIPKEELYGKKTHLSRRVLQGIGDGCREEFGKNIWIEKLTENTKEKGDLVISDVRYANEAAYIKKNGGVLIRIIRDSGQPIEYNAGHVSEIEQEKVIPDFSIHNDRDIPALSIKVDRIFDFINKMNKGVK